MYNKFGSLRFIIGLVLLLSMVSVYAATTMRPISDFTCAQGSIVINSGPAGCVTNDGVLFRRSAFLWGKNSNSPLFRVDYAGTDATSLAICHGSTFDCHSPTFTGTIVERTLSNGKAEVTIHLETHNAIVYVVDPSNLSLCNNAGRPSVVFCPALFGFNLSEMASEVSSTGIPVNPVLADSVLDVVLINTAPNAPIPDLVTLSRPSNKGPVIKSMTISTTATGPLRAPFCPPDGACDGTTGVATLSGSHQGNSQGGTNLDVQEFGNTVTLEVLSP